MRARIKIASASCRNVDLAQKFLPFEESSTVHFDFNDGLRGEVIPFDQ